MQQVELKTRGSMVATFLLLSRVAKPEEAHLAVVESGTSED